MVTKCMDGHSDDGTAGCDTSLSPSCSIDASCQPVQCNPMPPMKYISPLIQVGYVLQQTLVPRGMDGFIRMMEQRVVTHHSVRLVRVMAFDVEHITCGTLSSPSEGVSPTTSVFIDSCYACNPMPMTLVMLCLNTSRRVLKVSCAVHSFMLLRSQGRLKRREGQCPQVTPKKARGSMPSGDA